MCALVQIPLLTTTDLRLPWLRRHGPRRFLAQEITWTLGAIALSTLVSHLANPEFTYSANARNALIFASLAFTLSRWIGAAAAAMPGIFVILIIAMTGGGIPGTEAIFSPTTTGLTLALWTLLAIVAALSRLRR